MPELEELFLGIQLSPEEYEGVMETGRLLGELESVERTLKVNTSPLRIKELKERRSQIRKRLFHEE